MDYGLAWVRTPHLQHADHGAFVACLVTSKNGKAALTHAYHLKSYVTIVDY
jgi:hypothetical protein